MHTLQTQTHPVAPIWAVPTVEADTLALLARTCRDRERIRFGYRRRDGQQDGRIADPYRLASTGRRWYLVAWDIGRQDWRTYRVDRLTSPLGTGVRFPPREPPPGYVEESIVAPISRHRAVVVVHAPAAVVAERFSGPGWVLKELDEHSCLLRTGGDSLEWLALTVGQLGLDFTVREPPELIDHIRTLAARLQASTEPPLRQ